MITPLLATLMAIQTFAGSPAGDTANLQQAATTEGSVDIASDAIAAGRSDEAIVALERTRAKHANDPAVLINLGVAYAHRGNDEVARNLFEAALKSRTVIELETADGNATSSRRLARKALAMLSRGEFRMQNASVQR